MDRVSWTPSKASTLAAPMTESRPSESNAPPSIQRRELLRAGGAVGAALFGGQALSGCSSMSRQPSGPAPDQPLVTPPMERVRIGFVGVGGMGTNHVHQLMKCEGAEIHAICDIDQENAERGAKIVTDAGQKPPTLYTRGDLDFERMCAEEDLDVVYTATPWEWHVPVCVAAMESGKHAVTEVPAAPTVEGCWELVETAERLGKHCIMLENCCYDRDEMLCLNMVRQGLLGEVLHGECGYLHDLRGIKFSDGGEGLWRRAHSVQRDANLYPTHGLSPVAQCMDINRGDRLDYLVSMSGPSRGLQDWQREHLAVDDPRQAERYKLGDVNLTLIKTVRGKTIYLVHDTNLPRPYSRLHIVQGTKGIFEKYPTRVHIEGVSQGHGWSDRVEFEQYEHPMWQREETQNATGGHGGMDYLENARLISALRAGHQTEMNVYDAAMLSCIVGLTETSVTNRSRPVDVPDFTRGRYKAWSPIPIVGV